MDSGTWKDVARPLLIPQILPDPPAHWVLTLISLLSDSLWHLVCFADRRSYTFSLTDVNFTFQLDPERLKSKDHLSLSLLSSMALNKCRFLVATGFSLNNSWRSNHWSPCRELQCIQGTVGDIRFFWYTSGVDIGGLLFRFTDETVGA